MARKKKIDPVVEEVAPEEVAPEEVVAPTLFKIKLNGHGSNKIPVGINGVMSEFPCGVEFEVDEALYNILKTYSE